MTYKYLKDYQVNEQFQGILMVKNVVKNTAKNGKPYLRVMLGDKTGEIISMIWDIDEEIERQYFQNGQILEVRGIIGEYQGTKQLNAQNFQVYEGDNNIMSYLIETAPADPNILYDRVEMSIQSIQNEKIKRITLEILHKYKEQLVTHPAAKTNHHAYMGGLIWHTYSMLLTGIRLCQLYPILNSDLILAGITLHDIGKVKEYTGYIGTDFTLEGRLKGHIVMMSEEIALTAKELEIEGEEILLLQTMVLSHHGRLEYGSPVVPQIIEAQVIHFIDMIDANIESYKQASKHVLKGEFTEKIYSLGNVAFYKHRLSNEIE